MRVTLIGVGLGVNLTEIPPGAAGNLRELLTTEVSFYLGAKLLAKRSVATTPISGAALFVPVPVPDVLLDEPMPLRAVLDALGTSFNDLRSLRAVFKLRVATTEPDLSLIETTVVVPVVFA
jgi:hypothetical protein